MPEEIHALGYIGSLTKVHILHWSKGEQKKYSTMLPITMQQEVSRQHMLNAKSSNISTLQIGDITYELKKAGDTVYPTSDEVFGITLKTLGYSNHRCGHSSTIICSQFTPEGWHERLGGGALADSILDRMIPSAYTMVIDGDVSMRQRKRPIP